MKTTNKFIVSDQPLPVADIHVFETIELRNSWLRDKNMDDWVPDTACMLGHIFSGSTSTVYCLTEKSHLPQENIWITNAIESAHELIFGFGCSQQIITTRSGSYIIRKESDPGYISKCIYHEKIEKNNITQ